MCVAMLLIFSSAVMADCQPLGSQKPDDILCTETDTDGVASAGGDDTVTILSNGSVTVQGAAPLTSVTAIDTGNGGDTVINFGSLFAGLVGEADSSVSSVDIPVLTLQSADSWNHLLATGITLGNGEDYLGNHGSVTVEAVLNATVLAQVADATSSHEDPQPLPVEIAAVGIAGGNSGDVIENTGDITVTAKDNTGVNATTAVGINGGNGKDIITNTGTITVTASSAQPAVVPQTQALQVTTATSNKEKKPVPQPSPQVTATGIDAGNSQDAVTTNIGSLIVKSSTDGNVPGADAQGILAGNGKDVVFNEGAITVTSEVIQSDSSRTATLTGGDDLTATTILDASAIGIDSGNGGDIITNDGVILSEALAELTTFNVELNLVDTSHADTSVSLYSNATGIVSGNAKDTVTNTNSIIANATSRLDSVNVEINGADAGLADSRNILDSTALALTTGSGNDTIALSGSTTASAISVMDEVGVNVSYADVTIADREGSDTSTKLYSSATGIHSGSGSDNIYIDEPGNVDAIALSDVFSVGVSIASEGVPASTESLFIDGSLADVSLESYSDTAAIVTGQGSDELYNFGNVASNARANSAQVGVNVGIALIDFVVPTPGLVLGGGGTSADATSLGYDSGIGHDVINNAGILDVDAESDAASTIVSVNLAELSIGGIDAIPGLGAAVVAADTTTNATSNASGIVAGDGHDEIDNTGTIDVYADAHGSSTSASAGLGIQVGKGDDALQIDVILARAETQSDASAFGISGDDGHDSIVSSSTMNIESLAETDALGIGVDITGTLRASGGAIGATLTDTSSTSTAHTVGIHGGDDKDTIVNSGTLDVDATADTNNINASVTVGFVQKGLVAGAALGRSETEGIANAVGIDGGTGSDEITNDGTVDVKATSDVDSVAVSVTLGGTAQGLAAGAALADGGATATANATGIRSGDDTVDNNSDNNECQQQHRAQHGCHSSNESQDKPKAEIVNNSSIIVDAEADTNSTVVSADVQIAKEGAAIGAALADNSATAEATSVGIEGNELDNVFVNNGNIQLKSDADADAVSVGVSVQGTSSGLAAGAALTNASVNANATSTGIQTGDGNDLVINTGSIQSGNETERQVESTSTAVGVSVASQLTLKAGASLGAALADTDARAVTQLTAIDGEQGNDQIINQGTIDFQNVGANADAVSVSVDIALSPAGLAGGASVANSDSTAELTASGLVGAYGKDLLVNESNIGLHNMTADADAVSVSLAVSGTQAGVSLSGALVDADATATATATGLDGGDGEDRLYNEGAINIDGIHASTDAVGVGVGFSFAGQGVAASAALARSGATSNANATGLDGGAADDKLINDGTITLNNIDADSDAVSVSVSGAGTSAGVALSAGLTDASGRANANVVGMDGGRGNDYLLNNNGITVSDVDSDAHATGISISAQFSAGGLAAGLSLANTSAIANTWITGMDGGQGDDYLSNVGSIDLNGTATADALSVALSITASVGVGGGASITDASSTAQSTVLGIDGGAGLDDISNQGDIVVSSNAVTEATSASVGITVAVGGDVTLADAQSTSIATAVGIYDPAETVSPMQENTVIVSHHDSDNDKQPLNELINLGNITSTATADSEGLAISGNLLGYALGETTNISTANAAGIRYYQGPALIHNEGAITANSSATAEGLAVAVTLGGAALGDASTVASAYASGIESGGGNDEVVNIKAAEASAINIDARSYASGEAISVGLIGVQQADTTNTANATATGIDTGGGDDVVLNDSVMNISAGNPLSADGTANCTEAAGGACAESFGLSVTLAGYGTVDGTSIANANAMGVTAGEGSDIVQNDNGMTVTALARSNAEAVAITLLGANDAAANTVANASATGFLGAAGDDGLINNGNLNVLSGAEAYADSFSLSIAGDASANADTITNAIAVGIDSDADNDLIINLQGGSITASATSTSTADSSSWNFAGGSAADAQLSSQTISTGIMGGEGLDHILNQGDVDVDTSSKLSSIGGANAIFGNAAVGSSIGAETTATGIDSGADNDAIKNEQLIDVNSVANMSSDKTSVSFAGSASTEELITVSNITTGINGGEGSDWIDNTGSINIRALSKNRSLGGANAQLAGDVFASGKIAADISAVGIDTGSAEEDYVGNSGVVDATATVQSWATHSSDAGVFYSNSGTIADVVARMTALGVSVGDGNNLVENTGTIEVTASSGDDDWDNDGTPEGVFARSDADGGDFDIFGGQGDADAIATAFALLTQAGISAGDGDNWVVNQGAIIVKHSDTARFKATAVSDPNAGVFTTSGDSAGESRAFAGRTNDELDDDSDDDIQVMGIVVGNGENHLINQGEITVNANPGAYASSDVDGTGVGNAYGEVEAQVSLHSAGISAGDGDNDIRNNESGMITVTVNPDASTNLHSDAGDIIFIGSDADATAIGDSQIEAFAAGIETGDGDNSVINKGVITVTSELLAHTGVHAHGGPGSENTASAFTWVLGNATGIMLGDGENQVSNDGLITATADAAATGSSSSSRNSCAICGGDNTVLADISANAFAAAITLGHGENWIANNGDLFADAVAYADLSFGGDGDNNPRHVESNASAYGINSGDGNNYIVNEGLIDVTATASATRNGVYQAASALAIGIKTGDGDDEIINYGTINTIEIANGVESPGTAIDAGGGDDTVILGDGSVTNGDIDLGTGTDTLSMEGTPVINGNIIDDMSSLMLSFNNSGSYDGTLPGYRAEKNGDGTFDLSTLPQLDYLAVNRGTLQLNDDYVFAENSEFQAMVYSDGNNGQFLINGTASLDGQMKVVRGNGAYLDGTTFEVLNAANGIEQGTDFNAIELPAEHRLLAFSLSRFDNQLQVTANVNPFTSVAETTREREVAAHLDRILPRVDGELDLILGEVQGLDSAREFATALYGLSPADYSRFSQASLNSSRQYANTLHTRMSSLHFSEVSGPQRSWYGEPHLVAASGSLPRGLFDRELTDYTYGLYLRGFSQEGDLDSSATDPGFDFSLDGLILGYDKKISSDHMVGLSLGFSANEVETNGNSGTSDIDMTQIAAYGGLLFDNAYLDVILAYGQIDYDSRRNVTIGTATRPVESGHDGDILSASLSGGTYIQMKEWWLQPQASLQYTRLEEDGFSETGSGVSLRVEDRTTESLISQIGISLLRDFQTESGWVTPDFSIAWIHDFDHDDQVINAAYVAAPDSSFSIKGQDIDQDGLLLGVGVRFETRAGYVTSLRIDREQRDDYETSTFMGEFRYQF
jgi:uncharacterized protein YhjY with autotransporter beta-barrel domain